MIIKKILYTSFFIVFSYGDEVLDMFHLSNDNEHYIILDLESHNKTGYLLDEINTNICKDISTYGFKINGSYKYPIYNIIPKNVYFDMHDTLSVSQISFYQDHSTYFYDTNAAMNSYIRKNIYLLTLVESKTLQKENYTKKVLISLDKRLDKSNFEVGYMYHYESIPTYYSDNAEYDRSIENFSGKFSYNYNNAKIEINNQFNFETSNNQRYNDSEIEFQTHTKWNDLNFAYIFNDNISLGVTSLYKHTTSDYGEGDFNKFLLMIQYSLKKHAISLGNIQNRGKSSLYVNYLYYNKNYTFFINVDKKIFLNIFDNTMSSLYNNEQKVGFTYNNGYINTQAIIGKNSNYINSDYYYYLLSGGIKYEWFGANLNYGNNTSKEMFINRFTRFEVIFSPIFKNKKYRLYVKGNINRLGINPEFIFNQNNIDLIHRLSNDTGVSTISILDGEFGIIFKYFKISFIKENMFEDYYQYSTNNFIPNSSNYLVNIIWLFKD